MPKAEKERQLYTRWSLAFPSTTKPLLLRWNLALQTLTNSKHIAVPKLLLHKCFFFYSFKNNQLGKSCLFQGLYAWIKFKSLLSCLLRVMQFSATFFWQTHHEWGLRHSLFSPRLQNQNWTNTLIFSCNSVQTQCLIVFKRLCVFHA